MKRISRLEELQRAASIAAARPQLSSPDAVAPGGIYLFPGDADTATRWVPLVEHQKNSDLLFAVPGDGHPHFGLADVKFAETGKPSFTLRCGLGLWLPRTAFRLDRWIGSLTPAQLGCAKAKVREVLTGTVDGPESAYESEASPEYQDWMTEVGGAVERVADRIRGRSPVLTSADFKQTLPFGRQFSADPAPLALAAAGADSEEISTSQIAPQPRAACRFNVAQFGDVWLVLEADGVAIIAEGETVELPPTFHVEPGGMSSLLAWKSTPGGSIARAFVPWVSHEVRIAFGEGEAAQAVVVTRP